MTLRLLLVFTVLLPLSLWATHNRAGEIIVRAVGCEEGGNPLLVEATIITYTEIEQSMVDRDSLNLFWGDGVEETIPRVAEIILPNGIKRNEYRGRHIYPGPQSYFLSFVDENRVDNVVNFSDRSVNIPFSVYTSYRVVPPAQFGCNSTPVLTQIPLENACIGSQWSHNPGAFDADGDSLVFEFITPQEGPRDFIESYSLPNIVDGVVTGTLEIDRQTGQITWDAPAQAGEYNLAFAVISYRNNFPLDTVIRDMQIEVLECFNEPPTLEIPNEVICVTAGEIIEFDVISTAPLDEDQEVNLMASSAVFDLAVSPATFTPNDLTFRSDPVRGTFRWETTCDHISDQEYFVVFRAEDNFFSPTDGLATLQTVSIKVVAPPAEDLAIDADDEEVIVSWEAPYVCDINRQNLKFNGFQVWRRIGSDPFEVDTCVTGLAGRGYTLLTPTDDDLVQEFGDGRFSYTDPDVMRGEVYCYRLVPRFGQLTLNGLVFDDLDGIASEEICAILPIDIPILTNVDVTATDPEDGRIDVAWVLPDPEALDTNLNSGPYRYVLSRAEGLSPASTDFTAIATFEGPTFSSVRTTSFSDSGLNTEDLAYTYRLAFIVEDESEPLEDPIPASSIRLGGAPTDRAIDLSWQEMVPWTNTGYTVLRRAPGETDFTFLAETSEPNFLDEGLLNGQEYCYLIRATGTYQIESLPTPLINRSQIYCAVPTDNVPPPPPTLTVESVCDRQTDCTEPQNLFNTLFWQNGTPTPPDIAGYRVYYSPDSTSAPAFTAQIQSPGLRTFEDMPPLGITGCYFVTAVDSSGNESAPSNTVCVTNCPIYELPNAFTPNGDNQNDVYHPIGLCFIDRVEFKIFNRWGQLVYETEDPAINWDGTNLNGEALASGTYFYVGTVFQRRLDGVLQAPDPVSGYIELITGE